MSRKDKIVRHMTASSLLIKINTGASLTDNDKKWLSDILINIVAENQIGRPKDEARFWIAVDVARIRHQGIKEDAAYLDVATRWSRNKGTVENIYKQYRTEIESRYNDFLDNDSVADVIESMKGR